MQISKYLFSKNYQVTMSSVVQVCISVLSFNLQVFYYSIFDE